MTHQHLNLLRSKPLRLLKSAELQRYVFKAMTTWGTLNDFKYYLPRILELFFSGQSDLELSIILDKLNYGRWREWPDIERQTIRGLFLDWWVHVIHTHLFQASLLDKLHVFLYDEDLLKHWKLDIYQKGFKNFVAMIYECYHDPRYSWTKKWIETHRENLLEAFFYFENLDPAFAKQISDALYTIEHN